MKLRADAARIVDVARPRDGHALTGAAEVRRDLLGPFERRVKRPSPAHRHVRRGQVRTPNVIELQLLLDWNIDALDRGHLVRGAEDGAFRASAIVAADVDDKRVVQLAYVFHGLDHTADLMVGVSRVGRKNVRLSDEKFLFIGTERVPFLKLRAAIFGLSIGPWRKLGICRDYTEPFLIGEDRLAQLFPALIEQMHVADLLDPLRRRLVRRVRAAGYVIEEERLVRRGVVQTSNVADGLVCHVGSEIVAGLSDPRKNLCLVAEEKGRPLVSLATHEAVEVIETHPARPLVVGTRQT